MTRVRAFVVGLVHNASTPGFTRRARKFVVALLGVLAQLVASGVIPDPWAGRVQLALALATALGVYGVSNDRPSTSDPDSP